MKVLTDELKNAIEMAKNHPDTFECPTSDEIKNVECGGNVKISHNDERFWVQVTDNDKQNRKITGVVDNDLVLEHDFQCGDIIQFDYKNVYSIYT